MEKFSRAHKEIKTKFLLSFIAIILSLELSRNIVPENVKDNHNFVPFAIKIEILNKFQLFITHFKIE